MPLNTDSYTRRDFLEDEIGRIADPHAEYDPFENMLAREDEKIWAWYRDPGTDLTQLEARDRAQSYDYGDRYNLTQASVSRKINTLDEEMLTEPLAVFQTERPMFEYDPYRELEKQHPVYTEACRRFLAKMICDRVALRYVEPPTYDDPNADPDWRPPAWALDRLDYAPDDLISRWRSGQYQQ